MTHHNTSDNSNSIEDKFSDTAENEIIDPIQEKIDAIRLELYKETKDMNAEERINHIRQSVAPICEQYGIKPVSRTVDRKSKEVHKKTS
ncbi:MAG: hypothetical protein LBF82_03600 [Lactobacillales bacterium]|jgi:trans-2-enoyl-CoA reductase|nr:hypothetical protein [Lactobacillales bacterium]